jgi:ABC-2 type transport system ATP-binding protein
MGAGSSSSGVVAGRKETALVGKALDGGAVTGFSIECRNLSKQIQRRPILRGIELEVSPGEVFGFLGPNGAGKSTTIRVLLGLSRISDGTASVLSERVPASVSTLSRVGAMVEDLAFYPWLSGRSNLAVLSRRRPRDPVLNESMERAGIIQAAGRRVKTYSHGMRQRLGLALAICGSPELLILDEPANGLDPAGIRDMRLILRQAADQGAAVFVSSHQLSEVERACDRAAILMEGVIVDVGTIPELGGDRGAVQVRVEGEQQERALNALAALAPQLETPGVIAIVGSSGQEVSRLLSEAGVYPESVGQGRSSLEERFLAVTEGIDA